MAATIHRRGTKAKGNNNHAILTDSNEINKMGGHTNDRRGNKGTAINIGRDHSNVPSRIIREITAREILTDRIKTNITARILISSILVICGTTTPKTSLIGRLKTLILRTTRF